MMATARRASLCLALWAGAGGCATEHVIGAVASSRACPEFPRIRSLAIEVVSGEPDGRAPRVYSTECIEVPDTLVATNPMQVMAGLAMRGYIVDDVSEERHARVKLVGYLERGCPLEHHEAIAFCALGTRPLEQDLTSEGNTLFLEFFCGEGAIRVAQVAACLRFGVEPPPP